jgi:hypothetical protein
MTIHLKITISDIPSRDGEEVARQVERAISSVAGGIVQVDDLRDREALDAIATRLGTSRRSTVRATSASSAGSTSVASGCGGRVGSTSSTAL